jgi:hypothetical protein
VKVAAYGMRPSTRAGGAARTGRRYAGSSRRPSVGQHICPGRSSVVISRHVGCECVPSRHTIVVDSMQADGMQVPMESASNAAHVNGAQCVAHLRLLVSQVEFKLVSKEMATIVGEPAIAVSASEHTWVLDPIPADMKLAGEVLWHPRLVVALPKEGDAEEAEFVRTHGAGLYEVAFRVEGGKAGSVKTPYAKIAWIPI